MPRSFFVAAAMAVLAGCASGDRIAKDQPTGYVSLAPVQTAGIPWGRARTVTVTLSDYAFAPMALTFEAGIPYRLVLRNASASRHTFVSEPFFKAIAARRLVSAKTTVDYPFVQAIELPVGATKELQFLPMRRGTYPLHCSVTLHESFGMKGTITLR